MSDFKILVKAAISLYERLDKTSVLFPGGYKGKALAQGIDFLRLLEKADDSTIDGFSWDATEEILAKIVRIAFQTGFVRFNVVSRNGRVECYDNLDCDSPILCYISTNGDICPTL